jgi:NADH-quinone oxidoreductase subunit C
MGLFIDLITKIFELKIRLMNTELLIENFQKKFKSDILEVALKNQRRIIITIMPDSIINVADFLYRTEGFRFIIASALHTKKGFEIHYHFSKDTIGLILNIHVILDKDNPQIESLSNMFNASNWIEREMHELFGINFLNHPNQEKLISEGNWAEGVYPLRKEFK